MFYEFYFDATEKRFKPIRGLYVKTCAFCRRMRGEWEPFSGIPILIMGEYKDRAENFKETLTEYLNCPCSIPIKFASNEKTHNSFILCYKLHPEDQDMIMTHIVLPHNREEQTHVMDACWCSVDLSSPAEDLYSIFNKFRRLWTRSQYEPHTPYKIDLFFELKGLKGVNYCGYILNISETQKRDEEPYPTNMTLSYFHVNETEFLPAEDFNEHYIDLNDWEYNVQNRRFMIHSQFFTTPKDVLKQSFRFQENGGLDELNKVKRSIHDSIRRRNL